MLLTTVVVEGVVPMQPIEYIISHQAGIYPDSSPYLP